MKKCRHTLNDVIDLARDKHRDATPAQPPRIRETLEERHGSVGKAVVYGLGRFFIGIGTIFAAFIAAIFNLARKS